MRLTSHKESHYGLPVRRRLAALRSVRRGELLLLIKIAALAAAVPLLTRLSPTRLDRLLEPRRRAQSRPERWDAIPRLVDAAIAALHPVIRPGCLTRGITSYAMLRRTGLDVSLVFGVGPESSRQDGHCWLSRNGDPWLERGDPREKFVAMTSFPLARTNSGR